MASEINTLLDWERHGVLNPVQAQRLAQLREAGGIGSPEGGIGDPGSDIGQLTFEGQFKQAQRLTAQANAPAIKTFEESKPITERGFAQSRSELTGQKEPLKQRYQSILDELTRRETKETEGETLRLAREYSKRGIPLSSGVYEQATGEATRDISQFYGGQRKETGLSQEADIRGIENALARSPIEEAQALNQINQAIAALQAGGGREALGLATQLQQLAQQSEASKLAQQISAQEQAFKEKVYQETTLPESIYARGKPYYEPKSEGGGGFNFNLGGIDTSQIDRMIADIDKRIAALTKGSKGTPSSFKPSSFSVSKELPKSVTSKGLNIPKDSPLLNLLNPSGLTPLGGY